ncbi:MAG: ArsR family transcriptional regulator [Burkholderiales bacterium]|nr:ArsR family transcriptional regulator [Burkholderiales bacterium]
MTEAAMQRAAVAEMNLQELQSRALRASGLLKAMSNPVRLIILCQLAEGEKSVGELEPVVNVSQSALSQHLSRSCASAASSGRPAARARRSITRLRAPRRRRCLPRSTPSIAATSAGRADRAHAAAPASPDIS